MLDGALGQDLLNHLKVLGDPKNCVYLKPPRDMAKQKVSNPLLALLMGAEFMLFEILKILELQDVFKFCATSKTINLEVKKESYDCLWKKLVLLRAGMDPYKTLLRLHRTKRCPNYYSLALKGKWTKPPDSVRYTVEPYELDGLGGFRFQLRPDILIGQ